MRTQVKAGPEFRVNTYTTSIQRVPDAPLSRTGDFVVAWAGFGAQDGRSTESSRNATTRTARRRGAEFQVNTYTTGFQFRPLSASDRNGNFVVVWGSLGPGWRQLRHVRAALRRATAPVAEPSSR